MVKRLLMLLLASLALQLALRAMVVRTDHTAASPPPVCRAAAVVPALPEEQGNPASFRAQTYVASVSSLPCADAAASAPEADANGLPVSGAPYYRTAYAAFHLPDTSG